MKWAAVPGYPAYEVSNIGDIRRITPARTRPAGFVVRVSTRGRYARVALVNDGIRKNLLLHRLVCEAFNGARPSAEHQVAHNDGDPFNNNAANLRWATPKENQRDRISHGTDAGGERNPRSILNAETVAEIRAKFDGSWKHIMEMAGEYGLSVSGMAQICRGRTWKTENARDALDALLRKQVQAA